MTVILNAARSWLSGSERASDENLAVIHACPHLTVYLVADAPRCDSEVELTRLANRLLSQSLCCQIAPWATHSDALSILNEVVVQVNQRIVQWLAEASARRYLIVPMIVGVWRGYREFLIAPLGTSGCYRIREGSLRRPVTRGWLPLGVEDSLSGNFANFCAIRKADRVLLCSRGVTRSLNQEQILSLTTRYDDIQKSSDALVLTALEKNSSNGASAILIDVEGELPGSRSEKHSWLLPEADPNWLTWNGGCVEKMLKTITEEHRGEDVPILADALEEAGCTNSDILTHLREVAQHTPECWALRMLSVTSSEEDH